MVNKVSEIVEYVTHSLEAWDLGLITDDCLVDSWQEELKVTESTARSFLSFIKVTGELNG